MTTEQKTEIHNLLKKKHLFSQKALKAINDNEIELAKSNFRLEAGIQNKIIGIFDVR